MKQYNWLSSHYLKIINFYKKNKAHHALLIHSHHGNGELNLLYYVGTWLMCKKRNDIKNCNKCKDCILMKLKCHPDFYKLNLCKNSIGIDEVRSLLKLIYNSPYKGGYKIIYIPRTELLTEYSENSLLNILENPPKKTFFLMSCDQPKNLLPPFRSRCFIFYLKPPKEKYSISWINNKNKYSYNDIITSLRLNKGCILNSEKFLISKEWNIRKILFKEIYKSIKKKNFLSLLPIFSKKNNKNIIWWFISLLLDCLKWKIKKTKYLINIDQLKLIKKFSKRYKLKSLLIFLNKWNECFKKHVKINGINQELLIMYYLLILEK